MKRSQRQVFSTMLGAISSEIVEMERVILTMMPDELQMRLSLVTDKLDFIRATVETVYPDDAFSKELDRIEDRLETWYKTVYETFERGLFVRALRDRDDAELANLLNADELANSETMNVYGEMERGVFVYGMIPTEQMEKYGVWMRGNVSCSRSDLADWLLVGGRLENERVSVLERFFLRELLKKVAD